MSDPRGLYARAQRFCAGCFANVGLKLIALVIALIAYALVHHPEMLHGVIPDTASCPTGVEP